MENTINKSYICDAIAIEIVRCNNDSFNKGLATKHCSNRIKVIYSVADDTRTFTGRNVRISINGKPLRVGAC